MLFNIAESNTERARASFEAMENPHTLPGYTKSAILKPKSRRACFVYEITVIDYNCIVCTVRHEEAETTEAIIKLSGYTPERIEVEKAELFRNCSNYPYRTETSARYLKKYDQIACIVHGAIKAGLLYDTGKPQEAPETIPAEETANTTPAEETAAAFIVQCRSPRGSWTDYSSPATLEECETVKARAEARRTCDNNGNLLLYRITPTEQGAATERAETAPNSPATVPDKGTHTTTAEAARNATESAKTATRRPYTRRHMRRNSFSENQCGYG